LIVIGHKDGDVEKKSNTSFKETTKNLLTHTVIGGEFAVGADEDNIAFKTLLGSCVAIMFYDKKNRIKGMNHFLLPTMEDKSDDMKYGLYSVEAMLNEMYKLGSLRTNLSAKISGGADIIKLTSKKLNSIGYRNVEFAKDFCKEEGIPLISEHTRGDHSRLILLANNFQTFIKVTQTSSTDEKILSQENKLRSEISKAPAIKEYTNGVDLFDLDKKLEKNMEIELF